MYIFIKYDAKPSMSIREALHEINLGFYIHKTNRWHKRISYYMVIVIEAEWRIYASVNLPSLVQIMACRLTGAKPLSEPMLEYC